MATLLPRHNTRALQKNPQRLHRWLLSWRVVLIAICIWFVMFHHHRHNSRTETFPKIHEDFTSPPSVDVNEQNSISERAHAHIGDGRAPSEEAEGLQLQDSSAPQNVAHENIKALKNSPPSWTKAFPEHERYAELVRKAQTLPDVVMIPFEVAVSNDVLEGWEYRWVSDATYDLELWGRLKEPKIDFVYTWVNGSDRSFQQTMRPYELGSILNDAEGTWLNRHGSNRYRDWNELLYSLRSVEKHAPFRNRIQLLVNAMVDGEGGSPSKQEPTWLSQTAKDSGSVEILSQEEFFEDSKAGCLPTFNSLTIENQIHNTPSEIDKLFALSDDMLLGKPHAASDIYSPLYGPMIGWKSNSYSQQTRPTKADAERFGEKPWLIYTSWLLNRRFGVRKRKGMAHFGHSISRKVMAETMKSFPGPEAQSACSRFRGDFGFQLYSWYATFHYTVERHREALLWSYLMVRADLDGDGYLSWSERKKVLLEVLEGHENEDKSSFRARNFYSLPDVLEDAGLEPPAVNFDILWTSLDGPMYIKDLECFDFDINECLAPGFTANLDAEGYPNPAFSTAAMFDRASRQNPTCGDCLIKILLHRVHKGLSPLMPDPKKQSKEYDIVTKALMRYQYVVHEPDGLFVMVTDAEQVDSLLIKRFKKKDKLVGQLCLNDDVSTTDEVELRELQETLTEMYMQLFPEQSSFEK